jgi:hypothetical protein
LLEVATAIDIKLKAIRRANRSLILADMGSSDEVCVLLEINGKRVEDRSLRDDFSYSVYYARKSYFDGRNLFGSLGTALL